MDLQFISARLYTWLYWAHPFFAFIIIFATSDLFLFPHSNLYYAVFIYSNLYYTQFLYTALYYTDFYGPIPTAES